MESRWKEMYEEMFFRCPKNDFGERLTLFRRCFIPDVFGEYQYVENVNFYFNNREICEPIKLPCLREVYCAICIEENISEHAFNAQDTSTLCHTISSVITKI